MNAQGYIAIILVVWLLAGLTVLAFWEAIHKALKDRVATDGADSEVSGLKNVLGIYMHKNRELRARVTQLEKQLAIYEQHSVNHEFASIIRKGWWEE
jgi:hypothetical protein